MKDMRTVLAEAYLDFFNNYLTREKYAEHHGLTVEQAHKLLALGREIVNQETQHPES